MKGTFQSLLVFIFLSGSAALKPKTTEDRIRAHGYPVEKHIVKTYDGYILTMFRIPYPHDGSNSTVRPIVFLQHGLISSSDCWILNGPGVALAYMFVEAGYDVWLGNNRGNIYSRKHEWLSQKFQVYWNFEWHQIAVIDIPAMINYALKKTNQKSLHYVGHSQGTTVYVVLTSMKPQYNAKFKSAHLLAPVVYMDNVRGPLVDIAASTLGISNAFMKIFGSMELTPNNILMKFLKELSCRNDTILQEFCTHFIFSVCGWNKESLNMSIFNDIITTHPAGSSVNQLIHYMQEKSSKKFRRFDFGLIRNSFTYGSMLPPKYNLQNVRAPTYLYYGDNDYLSHPNDIHRLMKQLPNIVYAFRAPDPNWNHLDYLWSKYVKEVINDRVLRHVNEVEDIDSFR